MKLSAKQLRSIIKEEVELLHYGRDSDGIDMINRAIEFIEEVHGARIANNLARRVEYAIARKQKQQPGALPGKQIAYNMVIGFVDEFIGSEFVDDVRMAMEDVE